MSNYQKNGIGWQLRQWEMRIGEWLEARSPNRDETVENVTSAIDWEALSKVIFWVVIIGLGIWVSIILWQLLKPYIYEFFDHSPPTYSSDPKQHEVSVSQWLNRVQHAQKQGNYDQACFALYMAMLQRLHDNNIALHEESRTDGEYLQLTQTLPKSESYQFLLATHQRLRFGRTSATRSLFEDCQQAYSQL